MTPGTPSSPGKVAGKWGGGREVEKEKELSTWKPGSKSPACGLYTKQMLWYPFHLDHVNGCPTRDRAKRLKWNGF